MGVMILFHELPSNCTLIRIVSERPDRLHWQFDSHDSGPAFSTSFQAHHKPQVLIQKCATHKTKRTTRKAQYDKNMQRKTREEYTQRCCNSDTPGVKSTHRPLTHFHVATHTPTRPAPDTWKESLQDNTRNVKWKQKQFTWKSWDKRFVQTHYRKTQTSTIAHTRLHISDTNNVRPTTRAKHGRRACVNVPQNVQNVQTRLEQIHIKHKQRQTFVKLLPRACALHRVPTAEIVWFLSASYSPQGRLRSRNDGGQLSFAFVVSKL